MGPWGPWGVCDRADVRSCDDTIEAVIDAGGKMIGRTHDTARSGHQVGRLLCAHPADA